MGLLRSHRISTPTVGGVTSRARLWLAVGLGLAATIVVYAVWLAPLEAVLAARGHGIVDLELAFGQERFARIVEDWGPSATRAATQQVWWDFLWIPSYATTLWSALRLATSGPRGALNRAGSITSLLVPVAAGCDVLENVTLLMILGDSTWGGLAPLASTFASVKFALLAVAAAVLLLALAKRAVSRISGRGGG